MAVRDLRTYAEALGGSLCHYHDKSGLECDAVMRLENGAYGLIEIKTECTTFSFDRRQGSNSYASGRNGRSTRWS